MPDELVVDFGVIQYEPPDFGDMGEGEEGCPSIDDFTTVINEPDSRLGVCKSFDGFISPDGTYWGTKLAGLYYRNGSANLHEDFARLYTSSSEGIPLQSMNRYNYKDHLVFGLGWISCAWKMVFIPYPCILTPPKSRITEAQKHTLLRLFQLRSENLRHYFEAIGEGDM